MSAPTETLPSPPEPHALAPPTVRVRDWRLVGGAVVAIEMLALAVFSASQARVATPREDEVLALFVGRSSFGTALHQVIGERGGAPLHFVAAWIVVHLGGHLVALRLVSAAFAIAALPVIALLAARLGRDWRVGVVAAVVAAPSWLVLFHANFGRMYAMFLFFGALAPLLLLRALERDRTKDWAGWWAASLLALACHPYGAFVLGAGIATVLVARRGQPRTWLICAVPVLAGLPFWISDIVLRSRFDVGVGGGGESLGSPAKVAAFLLMAFRDAFSWHGFPFWLALALFVSGLVLVAREATRPERVLLGASFAFPLAALLAVRAGDTVSPQTRHLIFLLPFADLFVAVALVRGAERLRVAGPPLAVAALAVLCVGQVQTAEQRTGDLFHGDRASRVTARTEAANWIRANVAPNALLLGYDPIYYQVWAHEPGFSSYVVARADGKVAAKQLTRYCGRFDGATFIFDVTNYYDGEPTPNVVRLKRRLHARGYVTKQFGDFLLVVADTRGTGMDYVRAAIPILRAGKAESLVVADVALTSVLGAETILPQKHTCA